jgi:hypothetical protein
MTINFSEAAYNIRLQDDYREVTIWKLFNGLVNHTSYSLSPVGYNKNLLVLLQDEICEEF